MKKVIISFMLIICFQEYSESQISPPYSNSFDNLPADTIGWTHYAISGTDDRKDANSGWGFFSGPHTPSNAWITNRFGNYSTYSNRALETPYFNLTDTTEHYLLTFYQQRQTDISGVNYYLEYSVNHGVTWLLLDNASARKTSWQTASGFPGNWYGGYLYSGIDLHFMQGQDSVKFRFRCNTGGDTGYGWVIDDFSIQPDLLNVYSPPGHDTVHISQHCSNFTFTSDFGFINILGDGHWMQNNFYLSHDAVYDSGDSLLFSVSGYYTNGFANWSHTVSSLSGLHAGTYYILYNYDATDTITESTETDNWGYAVAIVDSVFSTPFIDNFENGPTPWKTYMTVATDSLNWYYGEGYLPHIEGAHSGVKAWSNSQAIYNTYGTCGGCGAGYLQSPFMDITSLPSNSVMSIWFKSNYSSSAYYSYAVDISTDCAGTLGTLGYLPFCREDDWDFANYSLTPYLTNNNVRFNFFAGNSYTRVMIDDVYIGPAKPDLSIERDLTNRFASSTESTDTLKYFLNNSGIGIAAASTTAFYWSTDSIFDAGDIFLGNKTEASMADTSKFWTNFVFTKPTTAPGKYYIFYFLDTTHLVDEMREYNNTGYFVVYQDTPKPLPYFNDFETDIDGWRHNAELGHDDWVWGVPNGLVLDSAFSGAKAWVTSNGTNLVSSLSRMFLYTPLFDFTTLAHPVMEFDMKMQDYGTASYMNMSYSIDEGATWKVLHTTNQSYNRWYYSMVYATNAGVDQVYYQPDYTENLFLEYENAFVTTNEYNSRDAERNTRYNIDISFLSGIKNVQFRYNLGVVINDSSVSIPVQGALIDNFKILDRYIDLNVTNRRSLMMSSVANLVKIEMRVKNQGNYIASPFAVKYYVSVDTILDGSDILIGQDTTKAIRPDMAYFINTWYNSPPNLANYKYLIYQVDAYNVNIESNELNNIGYWNLGLDSVSAYPYSEDFSDSTYDGWKEYAIDSWNEHIKEGFRFRNKIATAEVPYQYDLKQNVMSSDETPNSTNIWYTPHLYLESPAFSFENYSNVYMHFNFMCIGDFGEGGNMQYSTDGGNTWSLLAASLGNSYNWYNRSSITSLGGDPGWGYGPAGYGISAMDSTYFDLSFLHGQKHVVFRFLYYANISPDGDGTVNGMRVDNFTIESYKTDYIAIDSMVPISATITVPSININYSITSTGPAVGRNTYTKFFWSADSLLTSADSMIHFVTENPISPGSTYTSSSFISYPLLTQNKYYLFYFTDADSAITETNELNNIGSYKINFTDYVNSNASVNEIASGNISAYVNENNIYITTPQNMNENDNPYQLRMMDATGNTIYSTQIRLITGINIFQLPQNLASGVYLVSVENKKGTISRRVITHN